MLAFDSRLLKKIFKLIQFSDLKNVAMVCHMLYDFLKPHFPLDDTPDTSVERLMWQKAYVPIKTLNRNYDWLLSNNKNITWQELYGKIPSLYFYNFNQPKFYPNRTPYFFHPINLVYNEYGDDEVKYILKYDSLFFGNPLSSAHVTNLKKYGLKHKIEVQIINTEPVMHNVHHSRIKRIIGWIPDICYHASTPCCSHKVIVECTDNREYKITMGSDYIVALYQLCNRPKIPDHFDYVFQDADLMSRVATAKEQLYNVKV